MHQIIWDRKNKTTDPDALEGKLILNTTVPLLLLRNEHSGLWTPIVSIGSVNPNYIKYASSRQAKKRIKEWAEEFFNND